MDKVDLEEHQPIAYLVLQGSKGTWGLEEAGIKDPTRRELPGTRLVTFETRGGGAGFRVRFLAQYLTTVLQKSATSLHGNELPDEQPANVPNKVLLRIVPYLLCNTTAWAQAMQQCPVPFANTQLARWRGLPAGQLDNYFTSSNAHPKRKALCHRSADTYWVEL